MPDFCLRQALQIIPAVRLHHEQITRQHHFTIDADRAHAGIGSEQGFIITDDVEALAADTAPHDVNAAAVENLVIAVKILFNSRFGRSPGHHVHQNTRDLAPCLFALPFLDVPLICGFDFLHHAELAFRVHAEPSLRPY